MDNKSVVVLGAGHAGVHAAARLAESGRFDRITLVDAQSGVPYERPPLSKEALKAATDSVRKPLRRPDYFAAKGIDLVTGAPAVQVDRSRTAVILAGDTRIPYDTLILATGCRARPMAVPGVQLPGVFSLRTAADSAELTPHLVRGNRLVIIGAGYIGMEVAAAATERGVVVVVLEAQDRVMKRVTSEPVSRFFQQLHEAKGTTFHLGTSVTEFTGLGRVDGVRTSDGQWLPADLAVVGIGVVPNDSLAHEAGIDCSDGILVDQHCRTSDPNIYAIGDVTRFSFSDSEVIRLECVQNALHQAEKATRHILGHTMPESEVPWFWTVQHGVRLQSAGLRRESDETVFRGDPRSGRHSVLYLREGRLAAIDSIGSLADFTSAKKLIGARTALDPATAADPHQKLSAAQLSPADR
ncbi:NAD(P)/FAD-dependent oxidoreductase [Rhodococcus koreensis]|uniref:NAD(P)/FAD-dependent oxidoreductase n=1 Tax=Rhodococcus koreensis TaxID=99653 RepID=UPI0036D90063